MRTEKDRARSLANSRSSRQGSSPSFAHFAPMAHRGGGVLASFEFFAWERWQDIPL
eukprot:CAMPEP_0117521290 /NCGR_PEP_ID=MMETSP0784-20121206/33610_1 /TAXON_ID=39447 /ORGANISM="" /LENGTH=55 /DNA_ID=CAMNT_0005317315 /DNA_START=289 /DNA_END=456 /DNA_ORIENTATION=-